jgi:hypothetical protein
MLKKRHALLIYCVYLLSNCRGQTNDEIKAIASNYQPPQKYETVEVKNGKEENIIEIHASHDGYSRILFRKEYSHYGQYYWLTKNSVFILGDLLINDMGVKRVRSSIDRFDLTTGSFEATGYYTADYFSITEDEKYLCLSLDDYWKYIDYDGMKIPGFYLASIYLYNFENNILVRKYDAKDISTLPIDERYETRNVISFDSEKNRFDIDLYLDSSIPYERAYIDLNTLAYIKY